MNVNVKNEGRARPVSKSKPTFPHAARKAKKNDTEKRRETQPTMVNARPRLLRGLGFAVASPPTKTPSNRTRIGDPTDDDLIRMIRSCMRAFWNFAYLLLISDFSSGQLLVLATRSSGRGATELPLCLGCAQLDDRPRSIDKEFINAQYVRNWNGTSHRVPFSVLVCRRSAAQRPVERQEVIFASR